MTGPVSGEPERGGSATRTGTRDDVRGILILLALALTFRVIIAYLLPGSGFGVDIGAFQFWASNLFNEGLGGFYERDFFHDYTPGYLYVLWLVGAVGKVFGGVGDLIKIPPIIGDVVLAYLVWSMALELGAGRWAAPLGAAIVAVNPITWFDSAVWGQVDSVGVIFLLLAIRELWRDRPERSAVLTVIAAIIKPQLGILVPIVAAVTIRRALWPAGGHGDEPPPPRRSSTTEWEASARGAVRIVTTGLAGLATAILLSLPFGLSPLGLVEQIFKTAGGYPYLSVNAWNPWALVTFEGNGIAANHLWVCDMVISGGANAVLCPTGFSIGALPALAIGVALTLLTFVAVSLIVARRPDRRTILVGVVVLAIAFFVVPTRVHERYLYPLVALGAILAAVSPRWTVAYIAASLATLANMYYVLTTLYPDNPGISDWLGIGGALGSWTVITIAATVQGVVFLFALSELRGSATRRLAREIDSTVRLDDAWAVAAAEAEAEGTDALDAHSPGPVAREPDAPLPMGIPAMALATEIPDAGSVAAIAERPPAATHVAAEVDLFPAWDVRPPSGEVGFLGWLRQRLTERPIRPDRTAGLEHEPGGRLDRMDVWMILVLAAVLLGGRMWRLGEPYQMHFDEVYHPRTATEFLQFWRYGISHSIYEWTHPHLAKYGMALGIVAWGEDRTAATSDLGVEVRSAAVEPRWDDARSVGRIAGDRLWVATGDAVRAYDLVTRHVVVSIDIPGAVAVAVDEGAHRVVVGTTDGALQLIDTAPLDSARWAGADAVPASRAFMSVDGSIRIVHVSADGAAIIAVIDPAAAEAAEPGAADTIVVVDATAATESGRLEAADVTQVANAGAGAVALGTRDGVVFIDTLTAERTTTVEVSGPVDGLALATNLDKDRLYAAYVGADGPKVATVTAPGAGGTPVLDATFELPGVAAGWVGYDLASQMVHVLGSTPDGSTTSVYVVEPHANAVYADAALPFSPEAIALDDNQRYPSSDRQQLLAFEENGEAATVPIGQHAFAWRLPGVLAGVLMALLLYVLARLLFQRREVAIFAAVVVALDGMLFAQSRIGMNDAYVGPGIVAAYTLFAAIWRSPGGGRRHWLAFAVTMPLIGVCLGFALAAKWVAAYAIGGLGILVLTRSALGRLLLIVGMALATTALGYLAISVPEGQSGGNYLFLFIMVGLTLAAVVANVLHPIAWTWEEQRLMVFGPGVLGIVAFLATLALGEAAAQLVLGPIAVSLQEVAFALVVLSALAYTGVVLIGRWGFGPMALPPPDDDPAALLEPPTPAPAGWLRFGAGFGLPIAWILACLVVLPVGVYVASYVPWAIMQDHQLFAGWPPGHTGQTLIELTEQMYRYHNTLGAAHAASSPWWAWVFDFKPVWFYQESFAGGTSAAIYDAGNLVAWWLAIPALAFAAWQAFVRRSASLALVTIAFACQWIAWARIDRAAFQYHYYTSLPFVFLALAYFLAELWRGASRRAWLLARLAAAAAVIAPMSLWLFHRPLCGLVRVTEVNAGSQACPTLIPDFVLTGRALAIAVVVGIGVLLLVRMLLSLAAEAEDAERVDRTGAGQGLGRRIVMALLTAVGVSLAFVVASVFFDDTPLLTATAIPVEPIALAVTIAMLPIAAFVATARDARRFVVGLLVAMGGWFVLWYPNVAGLPLPSALSNAYQGLLPTYLYPFQFPVSQIDRNLAGPSLFDTGPALLLLTLAGVCVTVGYAAWVWRITLAERAYLGSDVPEADATA